VLRMTPEGEDLTTSTVAFPLPDHEEDDRTAAYAES
jgi:hypothetical protein